MNDFVILSDSACDLSNELIYIHRLDVIPFYVSFNGIDYLKENKDIFVDRFYEKLINNPDIYPKTSLPSTDDYTNIFKKYLTTNKDIICFCVSSNLSGSYQSALTAANYLKDEYPNNVIKIVDSQAVTAQQGLIVLKAFDMKKEGFTFNQILEKIPYFIENSGVIFTLDNLNYLQKGGRIGKVASIAGSLLNIKPIISFDNNTLSPRSKVRGRKKALFEIVNIFKEELNSKLQDYEIVILSNTIDNREIDIILDLIKKVFNCEPNIIFTGKVGIVVTSHVGPTATGIAFIKK